MKRRRTFDERGNPVVEVKNRDGLYEPEIAHSAIRKMDLRGLSIADTATRRGPGSIPRHMKVGSNPYEGGTQDSIKKIKERSGLDYMRALSAEIKAKRRVPPGD